MTELARKRELLKQAGYAYSFDREVYYNHETKKVFSLEFIEDRNVEELAGRIAEINGGADWRFYFNAAPSDTVKSELEVALR